MAFQLKTGHEWNPLKRHRNVKCPCMSGKKVKHCCGRAEVVTTHQARQIRAALRKLSADGVIEGRERELA